MNTLYLANEQAIVNPNVLEWTDKITNLAYIVAGLLFILALAGLSKQQTATRGNKFGMAGMGIALIATIAKAVVNSINAGDDSNGPLVTVLLIVVAMLLGAVIGIPRAKKVEMTGMPELIAMLHSFVGLAAVLIGINSFIAPDEESEAIEAGASWTSPAEPGRDRDLAGGHGCLHCRWSREHHRGVDRARCNAGARTVPRLPPGGGHRRRRHAGRRIHAELLLRLGRGGRWLHAG